jgi:hypothetical protein
MSQQPKSRPKVPEGKTRFCKTKQMEPNDKGFVGYQTIWDTFQKEVQYKAPKQP